jgi:hypothetical protein
MYKCKKISLYTGKVLAKEVFDNIDKAIAFCNNNLSYTASYRWVLCSNRFIK